MDLILWRHADAEDAKPGQDDVRRRLTERGERQAKRVAKWFLERRPKDLKVLVSPADRAQQTAHALGLPVKVEPRIGPGAEVADLLAAADWPEGKAAVMSVEHQPRLGQVAARIPAGAEADWNLKKGALWWISNGKGGLVLRVGIGPDSL